MNLNQLQIGVHFVKYALYATVVYLKEIARLVDDAENTLNSSSKREPPE